MKLKFPERRKFIRIEVPLRVKVKNNGSSEEVMTKNISPIGMRFEVSNKVSENMPLALNLFIPTTKNAINLKAKVAWQRRVTLEDNSPYDVGVEVLEIEEKGKNSLLKYLCDLLYGSAYKLD